MANIHRLSERQCRNARLEPGQKKKLLADGGNLYLEVTLSADGSFNKSWLFRYQLDGKRHELGLGPLRSRSPRQARDRACDLRLQILDGIDPLEARREAERERLRARAAREKVVTFRECAKMYLRTHSSKWRNARHAAQWTDTLKNYVYPTLGDLDVSHIDTGHVQRALEPIWQRIPETARRTRGRIEMILTYATAAKFRSGDNPASWDILQHLLGGKKTVEHHRARPYAEVPPFFAKLRENESARCRALQFTILTAARTGEVLGAKWSEIDLAAMTWTVPADRMKSGREHRVPLSDSAVALLQALPHRDGYVFHAPGRHGQPLNNKAMLGLLNEMRAGSSAHGFRSSFSDWAHERSAFSNHVIELSLAHSIGNAVEAAYRRGDLFEKRRQLMAAWAQYLTTPLPASATVTPLRKAADA
jgi:integrase